MTRQAFETALDSGNLQTRIGDRWYTCRRNGRTRLWKRDSTRFEIPIKYRFLDCIRVSSEHFNSGTIDQWFRIIPEGHPLESSK